MPELTLALLDGLSRRGVPLPAKTVDAAVRRTETWVRQMTDELTQWGAFWDGLCEIGLNGGADELAALRETVELTWQRLRDAAVLAAKLAKRVQAITRRPVAGWEAIEPLLAAHDRFHADVLQRWQTREDLDGILLDRVKIPHDRLVEWAKTHPPPQAWYDQDDDPFAPGD